MWFLGAATNPPRLGPRVPQVLQVTLPSTEEEASEAGSGPVVTEVTISLTIVAMIETGLEAGG